MTTRTFEAATRVAGLVLAVLTTLLGLYRVIGSENPRAAIDETLLLYIVTAAGLLLLHRLQSLEVGSAKLNLKDIEARLEDTREEVLTAADVTRRLAQQTAGAPSPSDARSFTASGKTEKPLEVVAPTSTPAAADVATTSTRVDPWIRTPGKAHNDPWKGAFGGKAKVGNRRLRAKVTRSDDRIWFRVRLWVESTDAAVDPLVGKVRFFLHHTFSDDRPYVDVRDGVAELRLWAVGAFTVGALTDDGSCELELDLAEDKSFPRQFREN